jgi:hypothetical protein
MEGGLMPVAIALDSSPANVLPQFRGSIVAAQLAFPDVLHVEVRDQKGDLWKLATQDADWSPSDPRALAGRSILHSGVDAASSDLRCELSDGSVLVVSADPASGRGDPPSWELIAPTGVVLEFGPGMRWQITSADGVSGSAMH